MTNNNIRGEAFTLDQRCAVWEKGIAIVGYDPTTYRQDIAGAWMAWDKYGDISSELGVGWEIDHRKPVSNGGSDDISNLRPLQWANNRSKGDDYPKWSSVVGSDGSKNIKHQQAWTIKE